MDRSTMPSGPSDKSIRKLTVAVWVVALGLLANVLFNASTLLFPQWFMGRFEEPLISSVSPPESSLPATVAEYLQYDNFHELPLDTQIEMASVIAITRYEKSDDGRMLAIISEILKQEPGTDFYYQVGEELLSGSYFPREGENRGDGSIVFFVGSPASVKLSMSFSGDRIRGLGDLPLQLIREKCEAAQDA